MPSLVFLCVANSARSQMAEGLARASAPDGWRVFSAGSAPSQVHPLAIEVMAERGIDIRHHTSKGMDRVPLADADMVIRLCAEEQCPVAATTAQRLEWELPDPAAPADSQQAQRAAFRAVRDEIGARLQRFWRDRGEVP